MRNSRFRRAADGLLLVHLLTITYLLVRSLAALVATHKIFIRPSERNLAYPNLPNHQKKHGRLPQKLDHRTRRLRRSRRGIRLPNLLSRPQLVQGGTANFSQPLGGTTERKSRMAAAKEIHRDRLFAYVLTHIFSQIVEDEHRSGDRSLQNPR